VLARELHPWRVSFRQAVEIQNDLRSRLRVAHFEGSPRFVAGTDVAYSARTQRMYAAVVVLSAPSWSVVEVARAVRLARFPYIPGLFAFRELPPLVSAFRSLRHTPDLVIFDGHGLAHPRRFGLACHAGLLFDCPAIGCAKSRLVGTHAEPARTRGSWEPIEDDGEAIGAAVRTRDAVEPVYVSVGHRVDLRSSIRLVLEATGKFRLPEPTRLAHRETAQMMRTVDPTLSPPARRGYPDFIGPTGSSAPSD
jgi:deoxyribonuclease V